MKYCVGLLFLIAFVNVVFNNEINEELRVLKCKHTVDNWKTTENKGSIILKKTKNGISITTKNFEKMRKKIKKDVNDMVMYCVECVGEDELKSLRTCIDNKLMEKTNYKHILKVEFASRDDIEPIGIGIKIDSKMDGNLLIATYPEDLGGIRVKEYSRKIAEMNKKKKEEENKPFYIKYWYLFLIPIVLSFLMQN